MSENKSVLRFTQFSHLCLCQQLRNNQNNWEELIQIWICTRTQIFVIGCGLNVNAVALICTLWSKYFDKIFYSDFLFFLSNLQRALTLSIRSSRGVFWTTTGIAVFGHPDVSWDRDFFMKIFLKWKFDHMYLLTRVFFQCKWGFTDATFFEESLLVLCNESEIIHLHLSFFRAMLTLFRCLAEATAFLGMFELDFEEAEFDSNLNSFWSEFLF